MASTRRKAGEADDALAGLYGAPGHLIRRCQQIAVAIFMDETKAFDLTPVQYAALIAVRAQPGVDQTRLVELIALDRSTIGKIVERLEAKALLQRRTGTTDKRTKRLYPTARGKALLDRIAEAVARAQTRILAPLAPAERQRFMTMLARLVDLNNTLSRAPLRRSNHALRTQAATSTLPRAGARAKMTAREGRAGREP
jgi:MarR family transcriptional regulator, lower aerobic nicotinate degradation pathway regulator